MSGGERVTLRIELLSDACFAAALLRTASDVDTCQMVDGAGLPYVGGRILKGLLVEEAALLVRARPALGAAARELFGEPGAEAPAKLMISDATLPAAVRLGLREAVAQDPGLAGLVTRTYTVVRRQTRIDSETGAAEDGSLRGTRLARRGTVFEASLRWGAGDFSDASADAKALLAAAASLVRRGGVHRNRGWGRLRCQVYEAGAPVSWQDALIKAMRSEGGKG